MNLKNPKMNRFENCFINPGHTRFIPLESLSQGRHFPKDLQNKDTLDLIQLRCDQTVRITINKPPLISSNDTNEGQGHSTLYGTGSIHRFVIYRSFDNVACPCKLCRDSDEPKRRYWKIIVRTSSQVVNCNEDAQNAEIDCFFDYGEKVEDCLSVKKLYGIRVDRAFRKHTTRNVSNSCEVVCVTHDEETVNLLQEKLMPIFKAAQERGLSYMLPLPGIVVSHPHGRSKHISVVNIEYLTVSLVENYKTNEAIDFEDETRYRYSTNVADKNTSVSDGSADKSVSDGSVNKSVSDGCVNKSCEGNDLEKGNRISTQRKESLLETDAKFILPTNAPFAMRFYKDSPGWWRFPPGTKYLNQDGSELLLPENTEFRKELLCVSCCRVTLDIEACPGCDGAAVYCDLIRNPFVTSFIHEGSFQ